MNTKQVLAAGFAALAALASAPAFAQQTATTSLHGFGYRLVDLDLDDGIAPSVSFTDLGYFHIADLYGSFDSSGAPLLEQYAYGAGTSSVSNADGRASASASGELLTASAAMGYHSGNAWANWQTNFVLSPHTQIIFSVSADVDYTFDKFNGSGVVLAELGGNYWPSEHAFESVSFHSGMTSALGGTNSALLSTAISTEDEAVNGYLYMDAKAGAWSNVPAVPEPGSAAMMLAGAALVGAVARRRLR